MKITGQILKENRERKGISISEVALATKINNRTIIAMEEGDVEQLPPKTFLRGFVKAYASYLELDVDSLMNTFYEEMGSTKPKTAADEAPEGGAPAPRQKAAAGKPDEAINPTTSMGVKIGAVTGILLLVVLIVIFKNKMESYEREAVVEGVPSGISSLPTPAASPSELAGGAVPPGASPGPSPEASPSGSPTPGPSATPGAGAAAVAPTATPAATPTATPHATPTPTPAPSATPMSTPTPTPKPTSTPTPTPTPKPSPTATPTPKPSPTASPTPAGRPQEVLIEALDTVEVDAQIDGEASKKIRLKAEQVQSIKARRKVILKFSDGGAVNLIVNGVERGVPGDLGKPLRLELP